MDGFRGCYYETEGNSGGSAAPGRTRDNGELNGVLNGKSSVFSHRFNVIASLTQLHCYSPLRPPPASLYFCIFFPSTTTPISASPNFPSPREVVSHLSTFLFFLRRPFILSRQVLRLSHKPWGSFPPRVHNGPFGFPGQSMCPRLFLQNSQRDISISNFTKRLESNPPPLSPRPRPHSPSPSPD